MGIKDAMKRAGDFKNEIICSIMIVAAGASQQGCVTMKEVVDAAKEYDKTAILTGVGAAGGAIIDKDNRGRGALIGGGLGAAGGLIWDNMEKDLREELAGSGVTVTKMENGGIRLDVKNDVTFEKGSDEIQPEFYGPLNKLADILNKNKFDETQVTVHGFTDSSGSSDYNQRLSEGRAGNVEKFLEGAGVAPTRVSSYGHGEKYADQSKADPNDRHVTFEIQEP